MNDYYTYGMAPQPLWPVRNEAPLSAMAQDRQKQLFGDQDPAALAGGGLAALADPEAPAASAGPLSTPGAGPVRGPGTGREDQVDARLSPGEYVWDAETVALLGDGNVDAGAAMLDQMRETIRAHKGAALAKGKISPDARPPLEYLTGGK